MSTSHQLLHARFPRLVWLSAILLSMYIMQLWYSHVNPIALWKESEARSSKHDSSTINPSTAPSKSFNLDEVVLILKTGKATPKDRLLAQLETFASSRDRRSAANTIIISDFATSVVANGSEWAVLDVIDALSNITAVTSSDKFKIYRSQQATTEAKIDKELHEDPPGTNNEGWTLDALKFLPGYSQAARRFPRAKWFIGLDDDNYLFWDNLYRFLSTLDHNEMLYMGSPSYMVANNVKFIHGGSVTISSQAAVKARFINEAAGLGRFHDAATKLCCGDGVLAMAYADLNIMPNDSFRDMFNGDDIEGTEVGEGQFCAPILGLHHLTGEDIRMIDLETEEWRRVGPDASVLSRGNFVLQGAAKAHSDVAMQRQHWDYVKELPQDSQQLQTEKSALACQERCMQRGNSCLAWTFEHKLQRCWTSASATRGRYSATRTSGLNIIAFERLRKSCRP